ncbi:beta-lactamase regulating signal transducer with metallopeptidase domain [Gelidibacter algens]|uniref:Beta-lactamase regulating signal transducer with metallopeptidase domain n=1 Tax=Gelidibacter algens TaxID=49280 RepID=A0A327RP20_9FLAO|nr:M56 family metallopeptidase [Gelidibacter algens]RAJ18679.1 beta-lactamase regulating signal transducer with metallopeptidase domain [Gelidibacter algens]
MEYLLKASALLTIFYGCYILFLQRETFFDSNRWFLVLGLLTSVLFPLFVIPLYVDMPAPSNDSFKLVATTIQIAPETFDLTSLFIWFYATVASFFLGRLIIQLFSLSVLIRKHDKKKIGAYIFVETEQNTTPFSFFRWIVYNPEHFNQQELQLILQHEKVHAKQMHSLDVLLTDIASALFWFNPFIWLYRKALKQNLEFIADYNTQKTTDCEERYQKLLLKTSLPQENLIFINTFYNSTIKKRIVMLHKSKSKLMNTWKFSIIIPLLVIFAMTFNTKTIAQTSDRVSESASSDQQNILKFVVTKDTKDKQLDFIKNKLADKGATINFNNVKRNSKNQITGIKIEYENKNANGSIFANSSEPISPIEISMNPSNGTIILGQQSSELSQTFDVDTAEDGEIELKKTTSKKIILTSENKLNAKSEDVEDVEITVIKKENDTNVQLFENDKASPLVLLDGTEISKEQMEATDPDIIGSVTVLKEESATTKYGEKGKNGVILITSKKGNFFKTDAGDLISIGKDNKQEENTLSHSGKQPLYILGDKEITIEQMEAINPNTIDVVNVLKDEKATKKYGKKGKNGVIIITLKKE